MNDKDTARCQRAINMANAGQTEEAYKQFCALYNRDYNNQRDVTLLYWLAYTTPYASEAQRTIITISQLAPDHPKLQELRAYTYKKQMRHEYNPLDILSPTLQCPYCHYTGPARVREKVSTAGWIFFGIALILIATLPFCWIGLLIKKRYYACGSCGVMLGEVA